MGFIFVLLSIVCLSISTVRMHKRKKIKVMLAGNTHNTKRHLLSTHDIYTFVHEKKSINPKSNFTYAFDADLLQRNPRILPIVGNHTDCHIVVTESVRRKLNDNKNNGNSSARVALQNIKYLHKGKKLTLLPNKADMIEQYASLRTKNNIIFVTNDSNLRAKARRKGLDCIELHFEKDLLKERLHKSRSGRLLFFCSLYSLSISISLGLSRLSGKQITSFELIISAFLFTLLLLTLWVFIIFIPYKLFDKFSNKR